jgi:mortality factor 4-like protein 1
MSSPLQKIQNPSDKRVTNSWDDWVPQDRVRKFTDENKELAANLHNQMKQLQRETRGPKSGVKKGGRANGSDFSSARGSEERHTSMAAQSGRGGPRRNRDYDLEPVSISSISYCQRLPTILSVRENAAGAAAWSGLIAVVRANFISDIRSIFSLKFEFACHQTSTWLQLAPIRSTLLGLSRCLKNLENMSTVDSLGLHI